MMAARGCGASDGRGVASIVSFKGPRRRKPGMVTDYLPIVRADLLGKPFALLVHGSVELCAASDRVLVCHGLSLGGREKHSPLLPRGHRSELTPRQTGGRGVRWGIPSRNKRRFTSPVDRRWMAPSRTTCSMILAMTPGYPNTTTRRSVLTHGPDTLGLADEPTVRRVGRRVLLRYGEPGV